jgi:NRAMP (natural resistance-associated macrophage protein)-like metal ion transporter
MAEPLPEDAAPPAREPDPVARPRPPRRPGRHGPRIHPDRPLDPDAVELARHPGLGRRALLFLGPGFVTGASDDDPSGIGTYAQAGAATGYATLWTMLVMFPMMTAAQFVAAKVGLVSGRGLAGVLRGRYPRPVLYGAMVLLVVANTLNAGADIGAIAAAAGLLVPVPPVLFVVPTGLLIAAIQVFGSYNRVAGLLKWLALSLLSYLAVAFFTRPDIGAVLRGTLVPTIRLDPAYIGLLVALMGTTISPYLFFWQASQEVDRQVSVGRRRLWQRQGASRSELRLALGDTLAGMGFSQVIAFFIVLTFGSTLFAAGHHQIDSAAAAAEALRPLAGDLASALLATGLISSGILAVPVLTGSAAYGVAETFGWNAGLDEKPGRAREFYAVIVGATAVGAAINFLPGLNAMSALVIAAVINGILAGPLLALLMVVSNDRSVMGSRTNGRLLNVLGWGTTAIMLLAAVALLVTTILG